MSAEGSGADDAVILRALEDAWNLGADVINLSLGSGGGFTADGAPDGLYCRAFAQPVSAGTSRRSEVVPQEEYPVGTGTPRSSSHSAAATARVPR